MNYLLLFLIILSSNLLQITIASIEKRTCAFSPKYDVYVANNLPPDSEPLLVHCASKDDELGYHNVTVNRDFHFNFCEIPHTLFFCHLWWNNKDVAFDVYNARWKHNICIDFKCYWVAKSDGIYFSGYYPPRELELKYSW
ncbi:hypothetical protein ABFS83_06G167200 [Erythranthe nasuta]